MSNGTDQRPSSAAPVGEEQYRLLLDSIKDYAIILLDPKGQIISWNPGVERIKGYRPEEIIGKHFSIFYLPEDIERGKPTQELEKAAAEGRFEDEGWRVRKDGSRFWANVIITPLLDKRGALRGYAKVTRDLTERKRMEEELSRQSREILELSTPVVQVWEGIVAATLIGTLDSQRTQQLTERLLERIVATSSTIALVDITGVPTIDTETGRHLIETITATRLLGAEVVLTGVRPAIAQTLVHLGIDLSGVLTRSSLAAGLRVAFQTLHLDVVADGRSPGNSHGS